MLKKIILSLFVIILLSSCGALKPIDIPSDKMDIVGIWREKGTFLEIGSNSYVQWEKISGNNKNTISAPLKKITDTKMIIGIGFIKKEFTINRYPFIENGQMMMTVNGRTLIKSPF